MLITYFGIIIFLAVEWIKFIKLKPKTILSGFGSAHEADQSRHPVHGMPAYANSARKPSIYRRMQRNHDGKLLRQPSNWWAIAKR